MALIVPSARTVVPVSLQFRDRVEICNIATGLLRAAEGALARRWLGWEWGRTSWKEIYVDRDIRDAWMAAATAAAKS